MTTHSISPKTDRKAASAWRLAPLLLKLLLLAFVVQLPLTLQPQITGLPVPASASDLERHPVVLGAAVQNAQRMRENARAASAEWHRLSPDRSIAPPPLDRDPHALVAHAATSIVAPAGSAPIATVGTVALQAQRQGFDARAPPVAL